MIKNIILIRHGQSQRDKSDPKRKLTQTGAKQIFSTAKEVHHYFPQISNSLEIFTSNTTRTIMSADILAKYFIVSEVKIITCIRVENIDLIETMTNGDVTAEYFDLYKSDQLPKMVSPPALIAAKFTEVVSKSSQSTENLIIVGHGCALEAFAYYQEIFEPAFPFSKELGYGDWLWLRRKVIN